MRVLLIKIPSYSDVISPPLGLGYLADSIKDIARVAILDGVKINLNKRRLIDGIRRFAPDIIGISVVSASVRNSLEFVRIIREEFPQISVIAGGPHPSIMAEDYLATAGGDLDVIIRGDAEVGFRRFVERCGRKTRHDVHADDIVDIPGAYALLEGAVIDNPIPLNQECSPLAMPAWELMPPAGYPPAPQGAFARKFPVAPLITSRGCPANCNFCSVPALKGRKIRHRTSGIIMEEIELLRNRFKVEELQIIDDNFTFGKKHAFSICKAIIDNNLVMPWTCPNGLRVDSLDEELVDIMVESGCYSISVGIESGSRNCLRYMNKELAIDTVADKILMAVRRGLEVNGFFIMGYPGETHRDMEKTMKLSRKLPLNRAHFMLFTPLPGCFEFDNLYRGNSKNFKYDATFAEVAFVPEGFTAKEIKKLHRLAILGFYLRPAFLWKLLIELSSPKILFYFLRRMRHWLGYRL